MDWLEQVRANRAKWRGRLRCGSRPFWSYVALAARNLAECSVDLLKRIHRFPGKPSKPVPALATRLASELHSSISVHCDDLLRCFRRSASGLALFVGTAIIITCTRADCALAGSGLAFSQRPRSSRSPPTPQSRFNKEEIRETEQRLADLGYWTGPVDGVLDEGSRQALIAFQKVEDRQRTGKLTPDELQALRAGQRPIPRESGYPHLEIDLSRQVVFSVDESGSVSRILPVSTGTGKLFTSEGRTRRAVTPCGRFTISHKTAGWRKSPLGLLYYPSYIVGGIAIHGNPSVPAYPASHGCIRIPMFAAKQFSEINPIGTVVIVYDSDSLE